MGVLEAAVLEEVLGLFVLGFEIEADATTAFWAGVGLGAVALTRGLAIVFAFACGVSLEITVAGAVSLGDFTSSFFLGVLAMMIFVTGALAGAFFTGLAGFLAGVFLAMSDCERVQ